MFLRNLVLERSIWETLSNKAKEVSSRVSALQAHGFLEQGPRPVLLPQVSDGPQNGGKHWPTQPYTPASSTRAITSELPSCVILWPFSSSGKSAC